MKLLNSWSLASSLAFLSASPTLAVVFPAHQKRSGSVSLSRPSSGPQVLAAASSSSANALTLDDVHDLIYIANVSIGGNQYPVQLDTGSSDLWVLGKSQPLPGASDTSQTYNLTYGIGWASGNVSYATVEFADITVQKQAFLDVSQAANPALSYNAMGILGLGFDSLSTVDYLVNATGSSAGRTFLYNMFQQNPKEPNFIAFSMQSQLDTQDTVAGSFAIGETDPQYSNVTSTNKIPTWPVVAPNRWNVLLDSFIVGEQTVSVSTNVSGVPSGKAVVLLDSGTSFTYVPSDVAQAIYGGVSGAEYNAQLGQWVVPCGAEINMALQFGNQIFPLNPLDVSPNSTSDPSTCVGSFIPQSVSVGAGQFDWLIGDSVLRSLYTLYDFGDFDSSGNMGNPYVQMLPLVDPNQASVDFHALRGGTPQNNITYNVTPSSADGTTTINVSADTLNKVAQYLPAMLAVMALNAVVLVVLVIMGAILLCRRRPKSRARKVPGRLSPMPMGSVAAPSNSPRISDAVPPPHTYQPVSMALTEDTLFVPPSPAFKGERPRSVA